MASSDSGAGAAVSSALSASPDKPFELCPGVVVDPAAECLYMMNLRGGIDAVELASGKLLWSTLSGGKPLALYDDWLVSQGEPAHGAAAIPLLILDTKQGGRVDSRIEVPMPTGVAPPNIDNRLASTSAVDAHVEPDGLLIAWQVTQRQVSGIPRPPQVRVHSGGALIDLQTHQVAALTSDQVAARLHTTTAASPSRLSGSEGVYFAPQRAGRIFVSVKLGPASAGQPATLKRWTAASGEPLPDIELGGSYVDSAISADRSLLLVVSRASNSGAGDLWSLYAIASGQRVAEARLGNSARPFFVWHSILIYAAEPESRRAGSGSIDEPLRVRGLDLKSGTEIWKRALRDTSYHGSYPPHL